MGANPPLQPNASKDILAYSETHRNVGVLQTTVAEIVTVKEHQRKSKDPYSMIRH